MDIRLKSGILYYVVFVLFIIWTICLGILLAFRLNSIEYIDNSIFDQLNSDLNSASNVFCKNPSLVTYNSSITIDLFKDSLSRTNISKKNWGILSIISVKTIRRKAKLSEIYLSAADISVKEPIALYMADENKYLSICGNTHLSGTCYLPKLGIKRGYVEGDTYRDKTMVYGEVKTSKPELPDIDADVLNYLKLMLKNFKPDSTIQSRNIKEFYHIDHHYNSFKSPAIYYCSDEPILIDEKVLKGNIVICSSQIIKVTKNSSLTDVLLFAPKIIIAADFQGQLQAFATDSLVVGRKCILQFPSALGLINEKSNNITMSIGEKSRVDGVVLLWQKTLAKIRPEVSIGKETEVFGQVYCNGTVKFYGNVYGSLYCRNFMLETRSAIYENHLLNSHIERDQLSRHYLGLCIADSGKNQAGIIKILR